jgi:hypothetical protein
MKIPVRSESLFATVLDYMMLPIMYVLQGNLFEYPQRTHLWNNSKYSAEILRHIDADALVSVAGDNAASQRWFLGLPLFHMPIFGGWKQCVVIEPAVEQDQW